MSKAEEKAMEKYPTHSVLIVPARGGGYYADSHLREGFIEGYRQAEKDLELTWEIISIIRQIMFDYNRTIRNKMAIIPSNKDYCKEVLKRFKERKENAKVNV